MGAGMVYFGLLWFLLVIIIWALAIGGMIFWIIMLVDVAKRKFPKGDDKTVWILIVALAGLIGAIIYYFMIKKKSK